MNLFIADLPVLLYWYMFITGIGFLFLPLARRIFKAFPDQGYALSKILGIGLLGYTVWLSASIHLLPFSTLLIWLSILVWFIINHLIRRKTKKQDSHPRLWLFEEVMFISAFLFWAFIRGHEPSLHSLEKYMDYGFMNSILKSHYFPPQDMWLAPSVDPTDPYKGGFFINYYYFGHYITAFLTKLTAIPSEITYNLMLSTVFALTWVSSFSIGYSLLKNRFEKVKAATLVAGGILSAFLVTLAGNLHTIYIFTSGYENEHPVPFWQIFKLGWNMSYWYPNATRFIPNTIHEFPSYSWVVADLHGHVLDIPFVLLTLAALLSFFLFQEKVNSQQSTVNSSNSLYKKSPVPFTIDYLLFACLLGFLSAVMYMTNAWDGLIYLGLSLLVIGATWLLKPGQESPYFVSSVRYQVSKLLGKKKKLTDTGVLIPLGSLVLGILGSFILFSLPFNFHFKPFVSGFGVVGGWEILRSLRLIPENAESVIKIGPFLFEKGNNLRSPFWMLGVLWGFFYFFVVIFLAQLFKSSKTHLAQYRILNTEYWRKLFLNITPLDLFLFLLIGVSTMLLIFPEFFYAKDIYPAHYRANTMFKLGYQAYIMLSLVSAYTFMLISIRLEEHKKNIVLRLVKWAGIVLILLVGVYPYFGIQSYYGVFSPVNRAYEGQDGIVWLKSQYPGDYDAIQWFRRQPTANSQKPIAILEAVGDSYTDYARISAYSGLPTPVGWPVHEWLWRGSYDEPGKRVEEMRQAYEVPIGTEPTALTTAIKKYNIRYIVVGPMEREKYTSFNEDAIKSVSTPVFTSGETTVYEVKG